jgi:hypothetical protein
MHATKLRSQDWEHRLHVLWAWREWRSVNTADRNKGATYRAVLDGCAVTIRALCEILDVTCQFKNKTLSEGTQRLDDLLGCCGSAGKPLVQTLSTEDQRCLLEVLYLGNRAVAHPKDGHLDHRVRPPEMTSAINTVLGWLRARARDWPALDAVDKEFLRLIR